MFSSYSDNPLSNIEVIRNNTKNHLFKHLNNINCIVSDDKIDTLHPLFKFAQIKEIADLNGDIKKFTTKSTIHSLKKKYE